LHGCLADAIVMLSATGKAEEHLEDGKAATSD